jgi:hypothetical protein
MSGIVKNHEALIEGVPTIVTTFTPTLDGQVGRENVNESWSAKRSAAGNVSAYGGTAWAIRMASSSDASNRWRTFRPAMCLFDTSSIGSGTIISATFQVALNNKTDSFSDSMSLVNATPASNSALANADWADFGTTKQASDKTIASFSVDGSYNTMELNATGLAAINKTGITKYGFTFTSLVDNSEPTWASDQTGVLSVQAALGTNPPQLVVTHTQSGGNPDTHTTNDTADVQIFTTTGSTRTWVKPSWANTVYMEVIGAGGGGAGGTGGSAGTVRGAGSGAGGGAMARGVYAASALPASLTITVGAGGTGGAAGSPGTEGTAGSLSSASGGGFILTAYGGGCGAGAATSNGGYGTGAGGGGTGGYGQNGSVGSDVEGGFPKIQGLDPGDNVAGGGGGQNDGWQGGYAEFGGGSGSLGRAVNGGGNGRGSIFGGGGGAGGAGVGDTNSYGSGGAGEGASWGFALSGSGGGAAGQDANVNGGSGGAGISRGYGCGDGGGGGKGHTGGTGGTGGNGGLPGGAGAGGGGGTSTGGVGGTGGRGEVRIYSW